MNIIIPMAGMGKRMRPHTLTTPKPLLPVGGKPIVQRLVEDITKVCGEKINEIAFIISPLFGKETEKNLIEIAATQGAKGVIYYQEEALGTAHAVMCAAPALTGKTVVAFADTLFKADFIMDTNNDGAIWVQRIDDPRQFGVVKLNKEGFITDFVEKPQEFVSDLAIIGIYYFKDGDYLKKEIQYLIDNNIKDKGEFQLTNALENMKNKGTKFIPGKVSEWLDCGNKDATVFTNQRVLEYDKGKASLRSTSAKIENSSIIEPCFIGDNVVITNSVVGPHVSIGADSKITNSILKNSIVQKSSKLDSIQLVNSMIGNHVEIVGTAADLNLGDYTISK
ncbi:MAG TPA: sugar phosphate nucleotidyltransferase [Bacteroidia bacterium]|nr:sugar phosphate nucleotidyltransferase [Bacteroidia bacterium]